MASLAEEKALTGTSVERHAEFEPAACSRQDGRVGESFTMATGDTGPHRYVLAWRQFDATHSPYLLPGDEALTRSAGTYTSYESASQFEAARTDLKDARFHLGLLPQPFQGPIEDADAYILMLNPGFDPRDYAWDTGNAEFRAALINQYGGRAPFLFLDERFRAHPGHRWWWSQAQLGRIAAMLAAAKGLSLEDASRELAGRVAAIELMPYHSKSFDRGLLDGAALPSVQLARGFVQEHVLPRARAGRSALVVARGNWAWGLREEPNVVVYSGTEPVAARVGPGTRGGELLLRHLGLSSAPSSSGPPSRLAPPGGTTGTPAAPPSSPAASSTDFSDPATVVAILDELVARYRMDDRRFRKLHHAKAYDVTVAAHRAYCTTDPKRPASFRPGGTNAATTARLLACLEGLREGRGWEEAIAAAVAQVPR